MKSIHFYYRFVKILSAIMNFFKGTIMKTERGAKNCLCP